MNSKLARKMILPIAAAIIAISLLSVLINSYLVQRYMLYHQKQSLTEVWEQLDDSNAELLERTYDVTIIRLGGIPDNEAFNNEMREELQSRNVGIANLWLWEGGYQKLMENGSYTYVYSQQPQYSILAKYMLSDGNAYLLCKIIPHTSDTIAIINTVTLWVLLVGGLILILFMSWRVRSVIKPLALLTHQAQDIASLNFSKTQITTGDETQLLAESLNNMSDQLQAAQTELTLRNRQMEELLSNVAHEVKTPVALIKAYCTAIRDGMDDGSFLDTISLQNDRIDRLVETLLNLSRMGRQPLDIEQISLSELVAQALSDAQAVDVEERITVSSKLEQGIMLAVDREQLYTAVLNIMTNAFKYGHTNMEVTLMQCQGAPRLAVTNDLSEAGQPPDITRIWEPFYVGEQSRCRELSGTGLGLPIVKTVLEHHGFGYSCGLADGNIRFTIDFRTIE